jgi:hypothetical protein
MRTIGLSVSAKLMHLSKWAEGRQIERPPVITMPWFSGRDLCSAAMLPCSASKGPKLFLKIFVLSAMAWIIGNFSKNVAFSNLQQTGAAAGKPQLRFAKLRAVSNHLLQLVSVLVLLAVSVFPPSVAAQTADNRESSADEPSAVDETAGLSEEGNFVKRLFSAYRRDWNGSNQNEPEAPRRISRAPLTSPPFPNADWNYGGSSVIGATNTTSYPLMQALYGGHASSEWRNSGVQIYGWINPGFNISTSKNSNLPEGYNIFPNRIDLDQAVVYVERVPDTVQTNHIDWGFRAGRCMGSIITLRLQKVVESATAEVSQAVRF